MRLRRRVAKFSWKCQLILATYNFYFFKVYIHDEEDALWLPLAIGKLPEKQPSLLVTSNSTPGVNFTNVILTNVIFLVTFWLCQKNCTKNMLVECWWNWRQESISSSFYSRIFHTKVLFLPKSPKPKRNKRKAAELTFERKMLMKLTLGTFNPILNLGPSIQQQSVLKIRTNFPLH